MMKGTTTVEWLGTTIQGPRETTELAGGFEAIYDEYHGRIFGLAYRMMGDADEAMDVTQEAFISAYLNLDKLRPQFRPGRSKEIYLSAWLHRIAANKCIDALRKRKQVSNIDWDSFARTVPAGDSRHQPELYSLRIECAEEVQCVLDAMTPSYKLVLLLQEHHGLSVREIARTIQRSESAVKSMLFRAREQFRAIYELESALDRVA